MSLSSLRLAAIGVVSACAALLLVSACGGDAFEESTGAGGMGVAGASAGGGANGGGAAAAHCAGPEDCDDGDTCTADFCTIEGKCARASKCDSPAKCCNGDCAECCEDSDCDDGVGCTTNTCFAGKCMYLPDDAACQPNEYCSVTESCRAKIPCTSADPATTCQDSSPCTTDSCQDGFCDNEFCVEGSLCCPSGCADECCDDAQCNDTKNPCSVGSCQNGRCAVASRCDQGDRCCPSLDGTSASCGACCSAADCDDGVACIDDSCAGARLACAHSPNNSRCKSGEVCNPVKGCQAQVQCSKAGDCTQGGCGRCEQGVCKYDCPNNQACCAQTNTCATCCGDASCDDGIACTKDQCAAGGCSHTPDDSLCLGGYCRPELRGCVQCTDDKHCDDGNTCTTDKCDSALHTCSHVSTCQCQTGFDCAGIITTDAAKPLPPGGGAGGGTCHACVDGKCQTVTCYGSCCSSGCYIGLCPD